MNVEKLTEQLKALYPDKKIILNKDREGKVIEIICEVSKNEDESEAIAIIDSTIPHFHKQSTETYEIIRGKLILKMGDEMLLLQVGDVIQIEPNTPHAAEGRETWLKVKSKPGWNIMDHIVVR